MVITLGREPDPAKRIRQHQGRIIREARNFRNMTRIELAEAMGVTVGAISQWENGTTTPRQHIQAQLAKVLNVPWSMIFSLDSDVAA
jgi:transcriptional regulator with XRE-family HTH domain